MTFSGMTTYFGEDGLEPGELHYMVEPEHYESTDILSGQKVSMDVIVPKDIKSYEVSVPR
jgi:hypothetical protein